MTPRKQIIINTIKDLVGGLLYYDRKEDEDLPRGAIEDALLEEEITIDEIVQCFSDELRKGLSD